MNRGPQYQPPRQSVVFGYTRKMLDETATNASSFAMVVADRYLALNAPDVRGVPFRLGEGDALFSAQKNNAQILRRFMDGSVKALPADLEDAWVLALPEPYRGDCERDLARRRGRFSYEVADHLAGGELSSISKVMTETGELIGAWGRALSDGVLTAEEERRIVNEGDDVIAAVLALREHMASLKQQ